VSSRFVLNPAGLAELAVSPQLVEPIEKIASEIELKAKGFAPVRTGAYRASISSEVSILGDRIVGKVTADVPYAGFIEFGTEDTPVFQPLRKALYTTRL
jgi:hypothetical protein